MLLRGAEEKPAKKEEAAFPSEVKEELAQAILHSNVDRIRKLEAEHKGIINTKNLEGKPMFSLSLEANQKASFDCMIELGVNIDGKDRNGFTALHKAGMQRRTEMGMKLIHLNAYPSRDKSPKRKRPDYWAWKSGDKVLETALRKHQHNSSKDKIKQRQKLKSIQ